MVRGGDVDDVGGVELLGPEVEGSLVARLSFSSKKGRSQTGAYHTVIWDSMMNLSLE
jgi:hypothetical protein